MEYKVPTSQRHNALKFAILEDRIRAGYIIMLHVPGKLNVADMFTKVLDYVAFEFHRSKMMAVAQQLNSAKIIARKLLKKTSAASTISTSISTSNSIAKSIPRKISGNTQYTPNMYTQVAPDATI